MVRDRSHDQPRLVLLPGIALVGVVLRVWQYAGNASLWLDEIALARGILERSLHELITAPLPFDQVAPKGFLLVEKIVVGALGPGEYALRLFPFLCSLIALVVFWRLAVRVLNRTGAAVAVLLFALAPPLIAFGALVKQYSTDVCAAVLLLWIAVELESRAEWPRRALWVGVGACAVWFSQPAVLVVAGLILSFIWFARTAPEGFHGRLRQLAPLLILWGASSLTATVVSVASVTPETREFLAQFWADGFPPASLVTALQTTWPRWQVRGLIGGGSQASLGYPAPDLYAGLAVLGTAILWRSNRKHAILLSAPIAVAVAAAVAGQYPFSDRLIVGLIPAFMIFLAASIEWIRERVRSRSELAANAVLLALVVPAIYPLVRTPPVYRVEDMRPVLSAVQRHRQPGDQIYVFYGAVPAVGFYDTQYGLTERDYSSGGCHRRDGRQYLGELDAFRSHPRVWIVITHPFSRERDDIMRYLDAVGTRRQSFVAGARAVGRRPSSAEAHLYDLSDLDRLRSTDAGSFRVTPPGATDYGCRLFDALSGSLSPAR